MRRRRGASWSAPWSAPLSAPPSSSHLTAAHIVSTARVSTLEVFHRALAGLVLIELLDRWSAKTLLFSTQSVGIRGLQLLAPSLDTYEWRPVLVLAVVSASVRCCTARHAPSMSALLLVLYLTLSLRAPTFVWILDRYAQTLLLISVLLPGGTFQGRTFHADESQLSSGVVALARLQVVWIYVDAALVKLRTRTWPPRTLDHRQTRFCPHAAPASTPPHPVASDTLARSTWACTISCIQTGSGAWWLPASSDRLSALEVYLRHTHGARLVRELLVALLGGAHCQNTTLSSLSTVACWLELISPVLLLHVPRASHPGPGAWPHVLNAPLLSSASRLAPISHLAPIPSHLARLALPRRTSLAAPPCPHAHGHALHPLQRASPVERASVCMGIYMCMGMCACRCVESIPCRESLPPVDSCSWMAACRWLPVERAAPLMPRPRCLALAASLA